MQSSLMFGSRFAILYLLTTAAASPLLVRTQVMAQSNIEPTIFVWTNRYQTSNITDTSLVPGTTLMVQTNVSFAPEFNAFELYLYYDPNYIIAVGIDEENGTVFSGQQTLVLAKSVTQPGVARISVVVLGTTFKGANGTLAHVVFRVQDVGISPLSLGDTRLALGSSEIEHTTGDGYFNNVGPGKSGPIGLFTYSPQDPREGDIITFDGSASFDPDKLNATNRGIATYSWRFGDFILVNTTSVVTHRFAIQQGGTLIGNFTVVLTVSDSDGFIGIRIQTVNVQEQPLHDIEIFSITVAPSEALPGTDAAITVRVRNLGTDREVFNLTVEYSPSRVLVGNVSARQIEEKQILTFNFAMKTGALSPGVYLVNATAMILQDHVLSNNRGIATVRILENPSSYTSYLAIPVAIVVSIGGVYYLMRRRRASSSRQDEDRLP